jgi:hypothetical protein
MSSVSRRRWLIALAACVSCAVGGCLSPTLPLPPPSPPEVTETDTEGVYRVTGFVKPNARAEAWNLSSDLFWGQQTRSDGAYDFLVEGQPGDPMVLFYVIGTDQSDTQDFVLP